MKFRLLTSTTLKHILRPTKKTYHAYLHRFFILTIALLKSSYFSYQARKDEHKSFPRHGCSRICGQARNARTTTWPRGESCRRNHPNTFECSSMEVTDINRQFPSIELPICPTSRRNYPCSCLLVIQRAIFSNFVQRSSHYQSLI
ncbi:cbe9d5a8-d3d2-4e1f-a7ae-fc8636110ec7-CDS [Sclerotinia trifoliorum]|uniref:Cbe9d5a8-d3d2-4e1f-a7ae-fc8636110ec7-CDS n=1 Tax=Sclerotinia trifoliorum TaxID=28548 RepID=A0A8H2ZUJ3_9HELO|nr:cbe9d5a8-d3d2-4e1f-a7ae-fc8636110ec7-CDS [Sclerotinia trifoliorum]